MSCWLRGHRSAGRAGVDVGDDRTDVRWGPPGTGRHHAVWSKVTVSKAHPVPDPPQGAPLAQAVGSVLCVE